MAFVAAVLGAVAQSLVPSTVLLGVVAILAALVLMRELGVVSLPVPENARLVPEHVQRRGRVLGPIQFGFEMGTGMRTYSPSALPHLVLAAIVLAMPLGHALAAGVGFAAARWIMAAASNAYSDDGAWYARWRAHGRPLAALMALATLAALAAGTVLSR